MSSPTNPTPLGPGYQQTGQYTGAGGAWVPPIIKEAITSASSAPPVQPGSGYRYLCTNVITGELMGDWLPITGQSFARALSSTGSGTCVLNQTGNPAADAANVAAVTARKAVLWVLQEGAVIWNGLVLDWQHQSILDGTLPLNCASLDCILARRIINTTLTYTDEDVFDVARNLVGYALGKTPNGIIANLTFSGGESGITDSFSFPSDQRISVYDALTTLTSTYNIEWAFRPYQDASGNFMTSFDLAYPQMGLAFPQSGLVYQFPGNILDYEIMAMGSVSANRVLATAQNTTATDSGDTLTGRATDNLDLMTYGFPLFEMQISASYGQWTTDAQVTAYAAGYLPQVTDTQLTPLLTLPGGVYPLLAQTVLGSYAQVSLTSWLHPASPTGAPGFSGLGRVTGWTLTPAAAQQAETTQIQMGNMTLTGDPGNTDISY